MWYVLMFLKGIFSRNGLTYCGIVTPYGDIDRVNIGLDYDLLADGTKPLPKAMLTSN